MRREADRPTPHRDHHYGHLPARLDGIVRGVLAFRGRTRHKIDVLEVRTVNLRRLVLGTLLASFRGPVAPRWAIDLVDEGLAGHVLFGFNVSDTDQVAALTASLRAARADVLIGIDEEGGDVTRLGHR